MYYDSTKLVSFTTVTLFLSFYGYKDRGASVENASMAYKVYRAADTISLETSDWDSGCWKDIAPLELTHYRGEKPLHIPKLKRS